MTTIVAAYYGNDSSRKDVLDALLARVEDNKLDFKVDGSIVPNFGFAKGVSITMAEESDIDAKAKSRCHAADQNCLTNSRIELREAAFLAKSKAGQEGFTSTENKLTVYVKRFGKEEKIVVPEGKTIRLINLKNGGKAPSSTNEPTWTVEASYTVFFTALFIILNSALYVFGILLPYTLFMRTYALTQKPIWRIAAYASAVASILLPGLGYLIILFYYGGVSFVQKFMSG